MVYSRENAPHIKSADSIRVTMIDVLIALGGLLFLAAFYHGMRAVSLTCVSVIACVAFEFFYNIIFKQKQTAGDFSAAVTGVVLAMLLPVSVPLWYPVVAAFVGIVICKMLFGGLGKNIFNPALVGVAFLSVSGSSRMIQFSAPLANIKLPVFGHPGEFDMATPVMEALKNGNTPTPTAFEMFIGNQPGALGTTCALLIAAASLYLIYRRIISVHIPLAFLGTVAVVALLFPRIPEGAPLYHSMLFELLGGSVIFCSIYAATDPVTSPIAGWAKVIFGIGCGLLTMLIRHFGSFAEGAIFAILIMNALTFALDKMMWRLKSRGGVLNEK